MDKAIQYSQHNRERSQSAEKFFKYFGDILKKTYGDNPVTLVDIGSGCGRVLVEIILKDSQLKFSQVVGADRSMAMVEFANENYGNDEIKFHLMDQESIQNSLQSIQFDLVTSFYSLHWVRDLKKELNMIHKLMKPDGLFLCIFLQSHFVTDIWDELKEKYSPFMDSYKENINSICFDENTEEVIKQTMNECGIQVVEFIDEKDDMCDFENEEILSASFEAINPCLKLMPENLQMEFLEDQLDVLYKLQEGKENPFEIKRRIFYFVGRKI